MAKYKLLAKHYIDDRVLDEGTTVGDETPFKVPEGGVTLEMEGLDDEGKAEVKKVKDNETVRLTAAPQLGLLYLDPEVREAVVDLARKQQGAKVPTTLHPMEVPHTPPKTEIPHPPLKK